MGALCLACLATVGPTVTALTRTPRKPRKATETSTATAFRVGVARETRSPRSTSRSRATSHRILRIERMKGQLQRQQHSLWAWSESLDAETPTHAVALAL